MPEVRVPLLGIRAGDHLPFIVERGMHRKCSQGRVNLPCSSQSVCRVQTLLRGK